MQYAKNWGWVTPQGRFIRENNMFNFMISNYIGLPCEDIFKKLEFVKIIVYENKFYAVNNKRDTDHITDEQKEFLYQNHIEFCRTSNDYEE